MDSVKRGMVSLGTCAVRCGWRTVSLTLGGGFLVGSAPNRPVTLRASCGPESGEPGPGGAGVGARGTPPAPRPRACLPVPPILCLSFFLFIFC